jgi:ankyrin repeat protein
LEYLCDCVPGRIRHALSELPDTLDETYERTLRGIKEANWEVAHRLFQFLTVASRPLHVEELAELLAFDFEEGPIPKFRKDWRLEDPVEAVLSTCSSLLFVVKVDDSKVIQFSHFSVKEFLASARLAKTSDIVPRRYHISTTGAHTVAARACLGFLLHLDENVSADDLQTFPLADYAAQHWFDHALFKDVAQNVEDAAQTLFHPRKPHFATWVWIFDLHDPSRHPDMRSERPSPPSGTPLHYVALCGLHTIVKFLAIELSQNVNAVGFQNNTTPLHLASSAGHVEVTRALLEHGSDVAAQCEIGATPLHEASSRGNADACRVLLEYNANVEAQDEHGSTPLHLASRKGHVDVALILLDHGADVTAQDEDGSTPLHLASSWGRTEVALLLLERGADVTAEDRKQESTPLRLALWWGHTEVAGVLREHGAVEEDDSPPLCLELGDWADVSRALSQFGPDPDAQENVIWIPSEDVSMGEYHIMMQLMNPPEDWDGESDLV